MTLTEKVRTAASLDDGPLEGAWASGSSRAEGCAALDGDLALTESTHDLLDWGVLFGVAFTLAKSEQPWASIRALCERAEAATASVWADFAAGRKLGGHEGEVA